MAIRNFDPEWQVLRLKDFSGGWASTPNKVEESATFLNVEITREKEIRSCLGSTVLNSTNISSSGTYAVHSIGAGSVSIYDLVLLAGTSQNKIWYSTSQTSPIAFTDITGAAALTGTYWSFTQFVNTSNTRTMLFSNETDGVWAWDGAGNIAEVVAAPNAAFITNYQGHVFAAVQPNALHFSEYLDYATWPGASVIEFSLELGKITGLASLPDKLLIFFQRGLGMINGVDADNFSDSFTMLSADQGTIYPLSISSHGSEVAMHTTNGPVILDPSGTISEYIAEPLRELFLELSDANITQYGWKGILTPFHYFLVKRVSPTSDSRAFLFDRAHKAWSELDFPSASFATSVVSPGFINTQPSDSQGFKLNTSPIVYGGEDGNVYALQLASLSGQDLATGTSKFGSTTITNTWKSKEINFGSDNILKVLRNIKMQMKGSSITVSLIYKKEDGSFSTDTFSGNTLPLNKDGFFSIANSNRLCRSIQIQVSGNNLEIKELTLFYKPKRFK